MCVTTNKKISSIKYDIDNSFDMHTLETLERLYKSIFRNKYFILEVNIK